MKRFARKLFFSLAATVLFFLMLELGLRGVGAGYPAALVRPAAAEGQPGWAENPFCTYAYFMPPMARLPLPFFIEREKPAGVVRVVVLGESAAMGDPVPAFGPPRMLEALLALRYPGRTVEVVNAAITAISSPVIRELARDLPALKPDVVLLYIGNNEVIGPYGPLTFFGRAGSDIMVRAAAALTRLRLVRCAGLAAAMLMETRGPLAFQGLARTMDSPVSADDPRLPGMRRRFERNLRDIVAAARAAGAEVLVSTVAVNRMDCPPSLSVHRKDLIEAARRDWERHYEDGMTALRAGDAAQALTRFEAAALLDEAHAELAYRMGQCLERLGRKAEADARFDQAKEKDAFRYRADNGINKVVSDVGAAFEVAFVDADLKIREQRRDADLFVDHVHFSPEGSYELARLWAEELSRGPALESIETAGMEWPAPDEVKKECLFTPLAELWFAQSLLARYGRPPFSRQPDAPERLAALTRQFQALSVRVQSMDVDAARSLFQDHLARRPRDTMAAGLWAQVLLSFHRYRDVEAFAAPLARSQPHRRDVRELLARALAPLGRPAEAAEALLGWAHKHGFLAAQAACDHMTELLRNGMEDEALAYGRAVAGGMRALDYRWRVTRFVAGLESLVARRDEALALMRQGNPEAAAPVWLDLARTRPDWPVAPYWLSAIHGLQDRTAESLSMIQQAANQWSFARACYHLGLWEAKFGSAERAGTYFRDAAMVAGDDDALADGLAWTLVAHPNSAVHDPSLAREVLRRSCSAAGGEEAVEKAIQERIEGLRGNAPAAGSPTSGPMGYF
ncbi:MAG: hypothetical protein KA248_10915 [Kiritimatiellae bacterium]|nr:hypothetical protein [Kiritimatiellia bacterium]